MNTSLEALLAQEADLQFPKFDSGTAWRLGSWIVDRARKEGLPIAVGITKGGQRMFHWAADGTCPDNDAWIDRKTKAVYRWGHSSYYLGRKLELEQANPSDRYAVSETEYAFHGGCFPLMVKGAGMVGTVTVSGLKQHLDHALVVEALRHVLRKPQ